MHATADWTGIRFCENDLCGRPLSIMRRRDARYCDARCRTQALRERRAGPRRDVVTRQAAAVVLEQVADELERAARTLRALT